MSTATDIALAIQSRANELSKCVPYLRECDYLAEAKAAASKDPVEQLEFFMRYADSLARRLGGLQAAIVEYVIVGEVGSGSPEKFWAEHWNSETMNFKE